MLGPSDSVIPLFKVFMSEDAEFAVGETLRSGYIGQGPQVEVFERRLRRFLDLPRNPMAMTSCTHALDLAFHLVGIGKGDEVISTPITCAATNTQLALRGAKIVWADVDLETGLISPSSVAGLVSPDTKAIVAVDWGGALCNYKALKGISGGVIPVIQDAAHSFGAASPEPDQRGDFVCWSFQAIKHLTCGDGGALLVPEWAQERAELLRWYGLDRRKGFSFRCKQDIPEAGFKYGMNDIAASIGIENLKKMPEVLAKNRGNARLLWKALCGHPHIRLPEWNPGSSWWLFTVRVKDQDGFIAHMTSRGVEASLVHDRNDAKTCFGGKDPDQGLPGIDSFAESHVCIPVGWWLSSGDLVRIVDAVEAYKG